MSTARFKTLYPRSNLAYICHRHVYWCGIRIMHRQNSDNVRADDETSSGDVSSLGVSGLTPVRLRPLMRQAGSLDDIQPAPYFTWQPSKGGLPMVAYF